MSAFILKLIATLTMLIDHSAFGLAYYLNLDEDLYFFMRSVGRIAFPIYAFLIAEGCRHTRSMKKYLLRLFAFALISEVPFDLLYAVATSWFRQNYFSHLSLYMNFDHQNVFFTLLLGALSVYSYELLKGKLLPAAFAPPIIFAALAEYMNTDYGAAGVIIIFGAYLCKDNRFLRTLASFAGVFWLYGLTFPRGWLFLAFACVSVILIFFYNGKKGAEGKRGLKWFFYAFYPLHLTLIFISFILIRGYW